MEFAISVPVSEKNVGDDEFVTNMASKSVKEKRKLARFSFILLVTV